MTLQQQISDRRSGILLFALTPPRLATAQEKAAEIAAATIARLDGLDLDGLVLYDIDDESDRNPDERPFPFLPTMDPADFLARHLDAWHTPVVIYRSVGKYAEPALTTWLQRQDPSRALTVFVGASSSEKAVDVTLPRAQQLREQIKPDLLMGGVAIPERHSRNGDEHERLLAKESAGASFFITQVIYDVDAAKTLVSDYHYECLARGHRPAPVIFTLSVCGSMKTLEFLRWLGVDVPRWLENDLRHAADTLAESLDNALVIARELIAFCRRLGVPFGFNVESVSNRRTEIEASVRLAAQLRDELQLDEPRQNEPG